MNLKLTWKFAILLKISNRYLDFKLIWNWSKNLRTHQKYQPNFWIWNRFYYLVVIKNHIVLVFERMQKMKLHFNKSDHFLNKFLSAGQACAQACCYCYLRQLDYFTKPVGHRDITYNEPSLKGGRGGFLSPPLPPPLFKIQGVRKEKSSSQDVQIKGEQVHVVGVKSASSDWNRF